MEEEKVSAQLQKVFDKNPALFLIKSEIMPENQILVVIDGDRGVSVEDCIAVSRQIEQNLDREEEDFSLEVTSVGIGSALTMPRQFKKNIARNLSVKTKTDTFEGKLAAATDDEITLRWKKREPKPVGKGKHTVRKEIVLPYEQIEEAKVMIKF